AECGPKDAPLADCWPTEYRAAYLRVAPEPKHFPVFFERLKKMWLSAPKLGKEELAKIKAPALVIAGDHDMIDLRETAEIFQSIPGAELWLVPTTTHFAPRQRAALFNETVDAFFREEPPAPAKAQ